MRAVLVALFLFSIFFPSPVSAAEYSKFEISGWIPYWRSASGTQEALIHINTFQEINPFVFTVKTDGTLFDAGKIDQEPWVSFFKSIEGKNLRVIPTIMWSDGQNIHKILSNKILRDAHIKGIVEMANKYNFDGVDIDYEAKLADTNPYFSIFLRDLFKALGTKKWLMCTVEPRTPLDSRNVSATSTPSYANDYKELNKWCDRVRIMAYDQASVDKKLTLAYDQPYIPVADVRWVEKVMREAMQTINKNKLMLGIPTYGYEYEVIPLTHGYRYNKLWAFNQRYAVELAQKLGVAPQRNVAGELSFIYRPEATSTPPVALDPRLDISGKSQTAISLLALTGPSFHIVWWSDGSAINDKYQLAKRLGVRGISIFKIDGGADPLMWHYLPPVRQ